MRSCYFSFHQLPIYPVQSKSQGLYRRVSLSSPSHPYPPALTLTCLPSILHFSPRHSFCFSLQTKGICLKVYELSTPICNALPRGPHGFKPHLLFTFAQMSLSLTTTFKTAFIPQLYFSLCILPLYLSPSNILYNSLRLLSLSTSRT